MSKQQQQILVHKVTLSSGKTVHLREMKIKYQNLALQACGAKAKDNQALLGSLMQEELLKLLLVDIDGKKLTPIELEKLDDVFSYQEYLQLGQVMGQLLGGSASAGEFQIEIASIGSN